MISLELPIVRASLRLKGAKASMIGTPVNVTIRGTEHTGIIAEVHGDHIIVEFLA